MAIPAPLPDPFSQGGRFGRTSGRFGADKWPISPESAFSLTNALSPMLFSADGYKVVVMPMVTDKAQKEAKAKATEQATVPSEPTEPVAEQAEPEPVTEPEPEVATKAEVKPKHSRKREKVAVA